MMKSLSLDKRHQINGIVVARSPLNKLLDVLEYQYPGTPFARVISRPMYKTCTTLFEEWEGIPRGVYVCYYCNTLRPSEKSMVRHVRREHVGEHIMWKRNGKECRLVLKDKGSFSKIRKKGEAQEMVKKSKAERVDSEKPGLTYCCHACSYQTQSLFKFRLHLAEHSAHDSVTRADTAYLTSKSLTPVLPHPDHPRCGTCGYISEDVNDLDLHRQEHQDEQQYLCSVCWQDFPDLQTTEDHCRADHPEVSLDMACVHREELHQVMETQPQKIARLQPKVSLKAVELMEDDDASSEQSTWLSTDDSLADSGCETMSDDTSADTSTDSATDSKADICTTTPQMDANNNADVFSADDSALQERLCEGLLHDHRVRLQRLRELSESTPIASTSTPTATTNTSNTNTPSDKEQVEMCTSMTVHGDVDQHKSAHHSNSTSSPPPAAASDEDCCLELEEENCIGFLDVLIPSSGIDGESGTDFSQEDVTSEDVIDLCDDDTMNIPTDFPVVHDLNNMTCALGDGADVIDLCQDDNVRHTDIAKDNHVHNLEPQSAKSTSFDDVDIIDLCDEDNYDASSVNHARGGSRYNARNVFESFQDIIS